MSPDPQTVREIAREAVRRGGSDSGYGFIGSVISDHAAMDEMLASGDRAAFGRLHAAVRAELKGATITVEWPDEQQPADVVTAEVKCGRECSEMHTYEPGLCEAAVTAEQQQDGAAGRLPGQLCRETDMHGGARHHCTLNTAPHRAHQCGDCGHVWSDGGESFEAVLAKRTALAAWVAELRGEREADTRAVAAVLKLGEVLYLGQRPTDWADARRQLAARFADRIAALDATETEES